MRPRARAFQPADQRDALFGGLRDHTGQLAVVHRALAASMHAVVVGEDRKWMAPLPRAAGDEAISGCLHLRIRRGDEAAELNKAACVAQRRNRFARGPAALRVRAAHSFGTGFGPLAHLPDANYWHYTLQLNVYRWFLETYYGLKINDMYIVIMHPNNTNYKRYRLNRMDEEVAGMLQSRKDSLLGIRRPVITAPAVAPEAGECDIQD